MHWCDGVGVRSIPAGCGSLFLHHTRGCWDGHDLFPSGWMNPSSSLCVQQPGPGLQGDLFAQLKRSPGSSLLIPALNIYSCSPPKVLFSLRRAYTVDSAYAYAFENLVSNVSLQSFLQIHSHNFKSLFCLYVC